MREIKNLMNFIDESPSMYHASKNAARIFENAGYNQLFLNKKWNLEKGGKYYLIHNDSSIFAFQIGENLRNGYRIVGAHTDSPGFKIKPNSIINSNGYLTLNTEVYGGPILNTWFDRPLSIAGRVYTKSEDSFRPEMKLINIDRDLFVIPNLAIHMKSGQSEEINPQKHTLPLITFERNDDFSMEFIISEELEVPEDDILSYDLFLYSREKSSLVGYDNEFISAGKLDNLGMIHAGIEAMVSSEYSEVTKIFAGFDNEEIGSATSQGADSALLLNIIKRINYSLNYSEDDLIISLYNSLMISADQAHSIHPNYIDKADPTNRPMMNQGPVIKESARKSYATDAYGKAVVADLANNLSIPYQTFVNRSDLRGGSTIGAITESQTSIRNIDMGNALLSMHSVRELGGVDDQKHIIELFRAFYEYK